jgi:nifR3 family TIM-barrel protein
VDINMGCWVPKIAKNGHGAGAALLRDVKTAAAIVEAVVNAVDVPVTVKIRSGWEENNPTAIPFAVAAEQVGVQAIAVHARFAQQGFQGEADWSYIRRVKEVVRNIPVIGNGDVDNAADAIRMMQQTGCDGVMIGRAALGDPWIFTQIAHEIRTGEALPPPTMRQRAQLAIRQAQLTLETTRQPPIIAIRQLRGQMLKYVSGFPDATTIRQHIISAESVADIEAAFQPLFET